jgi:hypothetical protein
METISSSKSPANFVSVGGNEKKTRVILGLPGSSFSHHFLMNTLNAFHQLTASGKYELLFASGQSSFVSFARMKTLGLDVMRGKDQKPFPGIEYDVWVTIDSDIVYTAEQLVELIESTKKYPVVSGSYRMSDLKHLAVVRDWDTGYFLKHGTFQFLTLEDLKAWGTDEKNQEKSIFMPVSYAGMGFWAMRREALEALEYPYFFHECETIVSPDGKILRDIMSEDVAFCKNLEEKGYTVYLHTGIVVGHEKSLVI